MVNTYQCYPTPSVTQPYCGNPLDANAVTSADKVEAKVDEVCFVCLF